MLKPKVREARKLQLTRETLRDLTARDTTAGEIKGGLRPDTQRSDGCLFPTLPLSWCCCATSLRISYRA
jgi:hypothetical protein